MPRMEPVDEKIVSVDAYIRCFERMASDAEWKKRFLVGALATLVKGRALEIYHALVHQQHCEVDALKIALMKGFSISADGMM